MGKNVCIVYVLDKDGRPLMPTRRCGHVRYLLDHGLATVAQAQPFTIRLTQDSAGATQPVYLGLDPGRTNIGSAAADDNGGCMFLGHLETCNKEIPKRMQARRASRQGYRCMRRKLKRRRRAVKNNTMVPGGSIKRMLPKCEKAVGQKDCRSKEARFCNWKRPEGWLTPTAEQLKRTILNQIHVLEKFLPVTDICIEMNRFDFARMDNLDIRKWQYQKGRLYGKFISYSGMTVPKRRRTVTGYPVI